MTGAGRLLAAGVIVLAGLGAQAPGLARQDGGTSEAVERRSTQTNEALLKALVERRSEILRTSQPDERERLLKLVDSRISEVKRQLGQ